MSGKTITLRFVNDSDGGICEVKAVDADQSAIVNAAIRAIDDEDTADATFNLNDAWTGEFIGWMLTAGYRVEFLPRGAEPEPQAEPADTPTHRDVEAAFAAAYSAAVTFRDARDGFEGARKRLREALDKVGLSAIFQSF